MEGALRLLPLERPAAAEIARWRYPAPYERYSLADEEREACIAWLLTPEYRYHSLWLGGVLIGYRCFGADAQVPGGDYSADALDMGGGLHPAWVGRGLGAQVMLAAIAYAEGVYRPGAYRATVADFNVRALRACAKAGYRVIDSFKHPTSGERYQILWREAGGLGGGRQG